MRRTDDEQIKRDFWMRQSRQLIAIAIAFFLVLLLAVVHKRPDLFGEYSQRAISTAQLIVIALFIAFTSANWRCPSCKKHLGSDVMRRICKKCGTRLR